MRTLIQRLLGLVATALIVGLVAGVPLLLVNIGATITLSDLPASGEIWDRLTRPDDGSLLLSLFVVAAWAAWAFLAVAILLELAAKVRGIRAPRLPGLQVPQGAARKLVATAALLFVTAPVAANAAPSPSTTIVAEVTVSAPTAAAPAATLPTDETNPPQGRAGTAAAASEGTHAAQDQVRHTVKPGDTLWSLAQQYLGDGRDYPKIAAANTDLIDKPDFLHPGWELRIPGARQAPGPASVPQGHEEYTVQAGDTLSQVAADQLGDPSRYTEIVQATEGITQPGGARLTDPDVIDVGWTLAIPTDTPATQPAPAGDTDPAADETGQAAPQEPAAPAEPAPAPGPTEEAAEEAIRAAQALAQGQGLGAPDWSAQDQAATELGAAAAMVGALGADEQTAAEQDGHTEQTAPWLLTGLTGAGGLLAAGLWVGLRHRRAAQFRSRRPGRAIATPEAELAPVEKTIMTVGPQARATVERLDELLRRVAASCAEQETAPPPILAVELTDQDIVVHLTSPADLSAPWEGDTEQTRWAYPTSAPLEQAGPLDSHGQAPYPLLVPIGEGDQAEVWLLNYEAAQVVTLIGDETFVTDFARFLAAQAPCTPWGRDVTVDCVGIAPEVEGVNSGQIRYHGTGGQGTAEAVADAVNLVDRAATHQVDSAATARAGQVGDDLWPARLVLVAGQAADEELDQLVKILTDHHGQTGTAVVVATPHDTDSVDTAAPDVDGLQVELTSTGRLRLAAAGLDLVAVGLTKDEAAGCAALLAQSENVHDTEMPHDPDATDGWAAYADAAGGLRPEHTIPRDGDEQAETDTTTLLEGQDQEYLEQAATTERDLATLSPRVPAKVADDVLEADPTLDEDLAAWRSTDCLLPRLTLLGPVKARTHGNARAAMNRVPYYTEMLSYLALRPHGATSAQLADAFNLTKQRARVDIHVLREWLGTDPRTGNKHLPDASKSPEGKQRGMGVYQVVGVLLDADLFRRLRVRAAARGGQEGIADLRTALELVTGIPFDSLREGGWGWLHEGDRVDQHLTVGVVDVAHTVATWGLHTGDLSTARAAAECAALAAPDEEIPRLDLAAIAAAEGNEAEAQRILDQDVTNRSDDGHAPQELVERTKTVIAARNWHKAS